MINPRAAFPLFPFRIFSWASLPLRAASDSTSPPLWDLRRGNFLQTSLTSQFILDLCAAYLDLHPRHSVTIGLLYVMIHLNYQGYFHSVIPTSSSREGHTRLCRTYTVEEENESERGSSPSLLPTNLCPAPIEKTRPAALVTLGTPRSSNQTICFVWYITEIAKGQTTLTIDKTVIVLA